MPVAAAATRSPRGRHAVGPAADLRLTVSFPGFDPFSRDDSHPLEVSGTVTIDGAVADQPVQSTLSLFPRGGEEAMRYTLEFDDDRGLPWQLTGVKAFRRHGLIARWSGLTQLRWEARPAATEGAAPRRGIVSLGPVAVARLLTTIRGEGFTRPRRVAVVARFAAFCSREALTFPITSRNGAD